MEQTLEKSYKNRYQFNLGTTSFIYPDTYGANAMKLAPYLDEIELLLFESRGAGCLPSREEVAALKRIKEDEGIDYNIHLPVDVSLSSGDRGERMLAVEKLKEVMDLTSLLDPTTYTLHLPFEEQPISLWIEHIRESMTFLLASGVDPTLISVETLDYAPELFQKVVEEFNLSVCLDLGHLIRYGFDLKGVFELYETRATIIHLHGVKNGRDHLALDCLERHWLTQVGNILKKFNGTVSLEVFSFSNLASSLSFLASGGLGIRQ